MAARHTRCLPCSQLFHAQSCRSAHASVLSLRLAANKPLLQATVCSIRLLALPRLHRDWARPCTNLRGDCAHPCHICAGTRLAPAHICTGTRLTAPTSAPGLGSPLPHLRRDWARPCHICTGTGLAAATSASGPGSPQPHLRRDWARPCHICAGTGLTAATSAPGLGSPRTGTHHGVVHRCVGQRAAWERRLDRTELALSLLQPALCEATTAYSSCAPLEYRPSARHSVHPLTIPPRLRCAQYLAAAAFRGYGCARSLRWVLVP